MSLGTTVRAGNWTENTDLGSTDKASADAVQSVMLQPDEFVVADGEDVWQMVKETHESVHKVGMVGMEENESVHVEFDEIRAHRTTILLGLVSAFGVVCCILFVIWLCSRLHERDRNRYRSIP